MITRKLRLQRGWSQEQVAQMSGLSVRTVQRIERGQSSSMESLKALAAVFEIDVTHLTEGVNMTNNVDLSIEEKAVLEQVKDIKDFYTHLIQFVLTISGLTVLNYIVSPGNYWVVWVILGWGIGVVAHGLSVFEFFNLFGVEWEKKQVEKRLGRKL